MYSCYIVVDPEFPLNDRELWRYANKIADIWYQVGLELDLNPFELKVIEINYPNRNERAASEMLTKWKQAKNNPPRRVLQQAIKNCRTQATKGMYIVFCIYYTYIHTYIAVNVPILLLHSV